MEDQTSNIQRAEEHEQLPKEETGTVYNKQSMACEPPGTEPATRQEMQLHTCSA